MNILSTILGLFGGITKIVERILDIIREKRLIEQGKIQEKAEQAMKESEVLRKQQEILLEDRSEEEVIKTLENGKF